MMKTNFCLAKCLITNLLKPLASPKHSCLCPAEGARRFLVESWKFSEERFLREQCFDTETTSVSFFQLACNDKELQTIN